MRADTAKLWDCHWWPLSARLHRVDEQTGACESGWFVAFDGPRCGATLPWIDRVPATGAIKLPLEERHLFHLEDQCPAAPTAFEKETPCSPILNSV